MMVNTDNLISITEANRNFSQVARMVDKNGSVVILKNNVPRYLVIEFNQAKAVQAAPDEGVLKISEKIIAKNRKAYEKLAKWKRCLHTKFFFCMNNYARRQVGLKGWEMTDCSNPHYLLYCAENGIRLTGPAQGWPKKGGYRRQGDQTDIQGCLCPQRH